MWEETVGWLSAAWHLICCSFHWLGEPPALGPFTDATAEDAHLGKRLAAELDLLLGTGPGGAKRQPELFSSFLSVLQF